MTKKNKVATDQQLEDLLNGKEVPELADEALMTDAELAEKTKGLSKNPKTEKKAKKLQK
jgi:hypothetical protein